MAKNRSKPVMSLVVSLSLVCAHLGLIAAFPQHSDAISYAFFVVWGIAALAACMLRAINCPPGMRRNWLLVSIAIEMWLLGTLAAIRAQFFQHAAAGSASLSDLLYFFYGVPMLLAIASPEDRQSIPVFFWLDGIQAAGVAFLAYLALFGVLPFSATEPHPMAVQRLIWIYDTLDCTLAVFATARLLVSPAKSSERAFFKHIALFLWTYAVAASIYNHVEALRNDAGFFDVLVDLPFALLTLSVLFYLPARASGRRRQGRRLFASLIDNARPALLGLAIMVLSAWIAREHLFIGIGSVCAGFVVYGIRAGILQNLFASTASELESARDRLEQLVLQDGLTGIANRRCFDQRFQHEWARARRTGSPLSLLLIDVDYFKQLNDTFGHLVGDECLIQLGHTLQKCLNRPGDLLARFGGEEFVALLPDTNDSGAINVAERLQVCLRRTPPPPSVDRQVTVSIGVTSGVPRLGLKPDVLFNTADRALYQAKQNGRNRTEFLFIPGTPQP